MRSRVGRRLPAHATAAGKALLAASGPVEPGYAGDLAGVRTKGFAVEDEELEAGTAAVASAVTVDGAPVAAIGVGGPAPRLRRVGLDELGEMTSIFAEELAADLARDRARAAG